MVVCNQLETAAQDDNVTAISTPPLNTTSVTDVTSETGETDTNSGDLSVAAIIGIATGGVTTLVFVSLIFYCCCCYHYRKQHHNKLNAVPQTTIQIMPDGYVPHARHSSVRASQIAHSLQASLILFRSAFKHKEKEELPHIVSPV